MGVQAYLNILTFILMDFQKKNMKLEECGSLPGVYGQDGGEDNKKQGFIHLVPNFSGSKLVIINLQMLQFKMIPNFSMDISFLSHDKGQNVACNRLGKPCF